MLRPDYEGGSIVNLMTSVAAAFGDASSAYVPLRGLPPQTLSAARTVVLLVIDGLGHEFLAREPLCRCMHAHLRGGITSVFPPTTTTAITTFLTGAAPQQHGLTGWFTRFAEAGGVVTTLRLTPRDNDTPLSEGGFDVNRLFAASPLFTRLAARCFVVTPRHIADSPFNRIHSAGAEIRSYRTLAQLFGSVAEIVRTGRTRQYVYAYWPELDHIGHERGIESRRARAHLLELDVALERFLGAARGSDTTVIVTGDHGMVDCGPRRCVNLEDHPRLAETLAMPLCGDSRTAYCYVHPPYRDGFVERVREELADAAVTVPSDDLLRESYFGLGEPHPALAERIGDFALLMSDRRSIKDWLPGERRYVHIGAHGGLSSAELFVPLILARA